MTEPLVSILMNCFNGEKYLREAIESVLEQSWQNWEVIFWDNQSTDASAEIFKSYTDPRLKYHYAPEHTLLYEARALALECVSGDYVAFLDVDDTWTPDKLARQVPLFGDAEVGIVCGNYWIDSEIKRRRWLAVAHPVPTGRILDELLIDYFVGLVTLVVRREALRDLDRTFGRQYNIIGDFDLVIRLAVKWKLAFIDVPTARYRLHGGNESAKGRVRHLEELRRWHSEMSTVAGIGDRLAFADVTNKIAYFAAMNELLEGNRWQAYGYLRSLPFGRQYLRVVLASLIPTVLARRLKN